MKQIPEELLEQLLEGYEEPEDLLGSEGLLVNLQKAVMERALEAPLRNWNCMPAVAPSRWTAPAASAAGFGSNTPELQRIEEAIADYDRAILIDSYSVAAYLGRCHAKSELGRHEEAIKDCDDAVHLDPASASGDG